MSDVNSLNVPNSHLHSTRLFVQLYCMIKIEKVLRGNGSAVELTSQNPEDPGSNSRLSSRRSSLISIKHAELLHVHCGLGQLGPLPTSGDDEWVAAEHCERAKRSRISDTHRLWWSLQFRYINNQSYLLLYISKLPVLSFSSKNQNEFEQLYFCWKILRTCK